MSPEWAFRYYSFDSRWAPGEEMASMRNGSGDGYSIVFSPAGVFVRGFAHESPMSPARNGLLWPGLVDSVPEVFSAQVHEPAFTFKGVLEATVCLWRQPGDDRWQVGDIDLPGHGDSDGADRLFKVLIDSTPMGYQHFADDYYETSVDVEAVGEVLALRPLTDDLVHRLNPRATTNDLAEDLAEIGYPSPPRTRSDA